MSSQKKREHQDARRFEKFIDRRLGQGSPSFRERSPLPLREIPPPPGLERKFLRALGPINTYLRCYILGECSVLVIREVGRWHLSISHPRRYPGWDEIAEARYRILPRDICAAILLPAEEEYINLNPNCFQVIEIDPTAAMVGQQEGL